MKVIRHIFFAWAAIVAVSCSKHNTDGLDPIGPDPLNSYIFFEAGLLDVAETKVDLITSLPETGDYSEFGVLGFYENGAAIFNQYIDNIAKVYRDEDVYTYDYLSPWMGSAHKFYAFCPYEALKNSAKVGTGNIPYLEYAQPTKISDMKDILGAFTMVTNTGYPATSVELKFQHLLWAFELKITNLQDKEVKPDGTTIENPSITVNEVIFELSDFPEKAKLNIDANYTSQAQTDTKVGMSYTISSGSQVLENGESKTYEPLLFIPVQNLKYKIIIKYTTEGGAVDSMTYPATGYKTASGPFNRATRYSLSINKKNDKFFEVKDFKPEDWTEEDVNHEFN